MLARDGLGRGLPLLLLPKRISYWLNRACSDKKVHLVP